ncbi:mannosyltransferase putative-domain-containing protein [Staphylotrichum tortipilum]|uniref:Mannosyltransferase putative-domain-containing protein n=1 Tax=Staphylotrichum tortipilum TaxID=2831512 RepID=A0AAN6RP94_9PEZI|nr:mannosyltransferase putative-domain-containing protein [Staphylotrichum longicolle]
MPHRAPLVTLVARTLRLMPKLLDNWWVEFFDRLAITRVTARPVYVPDKGPDVDWKPSTAASVPRPDLLKLRADDELKFYQSHGAFVHQLPLFASHLPFEANTTGIVTTAGAHNFGQAVSLVLMTRRAGSRLPIQILVDALAPWAELVCSSIMPRFNATCIPAQMGWGAASRHRQLPKFRRFQWKALAIVASSFQNVLFLDADCLPVRNPDPIFDRGAEPFTSTGLITFPDFWASTTSPLFYKIAGDLDMPPVAARATSESGILVYDKARHADSLLLAAYYNYNGPEHYYPMLSQHGAGEGDKETFLQAGLVLEGLRRRGVYQQPTGWMTPGVGVKKGYWDVKMTPSVRGRSEPEKKWTGILIMQADPVEDYRAVMAAVEKVKQTITTPAPRPSPPSTETGPSLPRRTTAPPDEDTFLTDSRLLSTTANLTLEHDPRRRVMFFHHNGVKPDFTRITDAKSRMVAKGNRGEFLRMWEGPRWVIDEFGRDVEKELWEDSMGVYCQLEMAGFGELRGVCGRMREVYGQVYV